MWKNCATEPDTRRGLGLLGMSERVNYLGGSLDIQSTPGRGTRVTVRVPLPQAQDLSQVTSARSASKS